MRTLLPFEHGRLRRSRGRRQGEAAFTMVEIAISIAVVAFALVAIMGVMPTGFQVQKQNREDTIINLDGTLWLDAIRQGARGMDYLTGYVDRIELQTVGVQGNQARTNVADVTPLLRNGGDIIGVLTQPRRTGGAQNQETNRVVAYVRAISGSAGTKAPQNPFNFRYRMTSEILPFSQVQGINTNLNEFNLPADELAARSNLVRRAANLALNLYEVRLTCDWPIYEMGAGAGAGAQPVLRVGNNQRVFRTLVSGRMLSTNSTVSQLNLHFLEPSRFVRVQ